MNHEDSESQEAMPSYVEQVSAVVRMLRALFGMSQADLAKASGVSRPTINRVETLREAEKVRRGTLEALLAVFRRIGVCLELSDSGLMVSLPTGTLMMAVEAGRHQGRTERKRQDTLEMILRMQRNVRLDRPVELSAEDFERLRNSMSAPDFDKGQE